MGGVTLRRNCVRFVTYGVGKLATAEGNRYIDAMANPASIFDLVDDDAKRRAVEQGLAEADAGLGVPHEIVSEWLRKLAKGERTPPPIPPESA